MAKTLKDLPIGSIVREKSATMYGKEIYWIKISDEFKGAGGTTLITQNIIKYMCFDAREPKNPDTYCQMYGNTNYLDSNIRNWLISDKRYWYSPSHKYDQAPDAGHVHGTNDPYANTPGFMYGWSEEFQKAIKEKPHLLEETNIKNIEYFEEWSNRSARPTSEARMQSTLLDPPNAWWTATQHSNPRVVVINSNGSTMGDWPHRSLGLRPVVILRSDLNVAEDKDRPGEYMPLYTYNSVPEVQDKTISGKTLYEQNILNINGSAMDTDANDVVSVKYRVNSGTTRPLATGIGSTSYNKSLQFKQGYLYDGDTKVSTQLSDGTQHNIRLWAEDDKGAKSEEVVITFYVVNNRPSKLQIDQILEQNDLVESDTVLLTGRVEDPEGHDTTIFYRVGGSSYSKVNTGKDRDFEIRIPVNKLVNGENLVTIKSEDTYGAITERTARLTKSGISTPLKTGVIEYKMTPPEGSAKGLLIWIQREIGDLSTKVEVKFGDNPYKTLEKNHVGLVTEGLEEDEYVYENDTEESDIRLRITMSRMSTSSNKAIKKISGVFN